MTDEQNVVDQLARIVKELKDNKDGYFSTKYELWTLAAKIQENMIRDRANNLYANAHIVWEGSKGKSALEKIGMELQSFNETIGMELSKFNENNNNF
ncbi:MAG: hypothetical protein ACOVNU_02825 [Candidatus Kapaibacteriota bacterium]